MRFSEVHIKNFRGIRDLKLNDLKQVNLFLGKNNCGKTSILDGLFLLSGMSNPLLLIRINQFRDYLIQNSDDLSLFYYNQDFENTITLKGTYPDTGFRELQIAPLFSDVKKISIDNLLNENALTNKEAISRNGLRFNFIEDEGADKNNKNSASITFSNATNGKKTNVNIRGAKEYKESIHSIFLNSKSTFSFAVDRLEELIDRKEEMKIVEILQHVEPRIKGISVLRSVVKVDIGGNNLLPLNMLGDGVRKLFAIIIALYDCKDGIVLIDEIDNGLHYSTLRLLWTTIFKTAKEFNVQVMASTHNMELLVSLKNLLMENECIENQQDLACYSLKRYENDDLVAYRYDYDNLLYAINQEIEIR